MVYSYFLLIVLKIIILKTKGTISLTELKHIFPGSKIDDDEW